MRAAVVGHVEWIEFVRVPYVPAPGEIVHASERWQTVGGGGAIVAVDLVRLGGEVTLFTALGDDRLGRRALDELVAHGVRVESTFRPEPQRRCFVYVDDEHERTITVIGDRMGPSGGDPLAWGGSGDARARAGLRPGYFPGVVIFSNPSLPRSDWKSSS